MSAILAPEQLLAEVLGPGRKVDDADGLVIFSGTIPLLGEADGQSGWFGCELYDARNDRRISAGYAVRVLASD